MTFQSKNMNYIFNVEYFDKLKLLQKDEENKNIIEERNKAIENFGFSPVGLFDEIANEEGYEAFDLFTQYPGLLVGVGNPHEVAVEGAIKCGFSFDYVTGVPYIAGSGLKGMLRSCFPGEYSGELRDEHEGVIRIMLKKAFTEAGESVENDVLTRLDVHAFENNIFENGDIFLGAFPVVKDKDKLLLTEYITPHKEKFQSPNPISMIKVKPAVKFRFSAIYRDYLDTETGICVNAKVKCRLFEELVLLFGIGAKTNVGFGKFSKERPKATVMVERPLAKEGNWTKPNGHKTNGYKQNGYKPEGQLCVRCKRNKVTWNKKIGEYNKLCQSCFEKTR